jgi:exodeoxyribonuclease VII large subunit
MASLTPIRLSDLTRQIQDTLQSSFGGQSFWVVGEVTNHQYRPRDQWHFFTLAEKEESAHTIVAKAETVAWKVGSNRIAHFEQVTGQPLKDGIQVLVKVTVDYSPLYGLKLTLQDIDVNYTIGLLEQQRQAVLDRLLTECSDFIRKVGDRYITTNNQLPLPLVIQRIALVASHTSAGYEDFMHILKTNAFGYAFQVDPYFTVIQGEGAAAAVRGKLLDIFQAPATYDAVVLIRGGGASTDFLIFDTFPLGQIAAKFPIPIITGIGHQRNESIVDLMVHTPTNAPTKAAEFIIAHNRRFEEACQHTQQTILIRTQQLFIYHSRALAEVRHNLGSMASGFTQAQKSHLENTSRNLGVYQRNFFSNQRGYLAHWARVIELLNPENLLKKGFALVYYKGKIIVDPGQIPDGADISVRLADGKIEATVRQVVPHR